MPSFLSRLYKSDYKSLLSPTVNLYYTFTSVFYCDIWLRFIVKIFADPGHKFNSDESHADYIENQSDDKQALQSQWDTDPALSAFSLRIQTQKWGDPQNVYSSNNYLETNANIVKDPDAEPFFVRGSFGACEHYH